MNVSDFSIQRPKFTVVIMILLILLGTVSFTRLPLQLFPDIEAPVAAVATSYPGAGPEEVLNDITDPLERDLSTISGLNNISSQSIEGSSMIILEFSWDMSIRDIENEIVTTINQTNLPDGANTPAFLRFDPSMMPNVQLAVSSDEDDVTAFQDLVFDLQRELTRVQGVADISESGSLIENYEVTLDQESLEDAGTTQDQVVQTIQSHNITMPGGIIRNGERNITTRVMSELTSAEDIEELVIGIDRESGEQIVIGDIATVSLETEAQEVITRLNQEPALQLSMSQESDANTTQVSNALNDRLNELLAEEQYADLYVATLYDEGEFIQEAVDNVLLAITSGGVLAMVVLFAFLRNLKTPLIIGIAIPFSIIVTFALFFFTDISLNMLTLGGLALGIGMIVDNSIVVVENIFRHLSMKKEPKQAASEGTKEVAGAITASTLTTASVFLPMVFVTGMVGDLFVPLSLAVTFSLFASLFVALTVVPMVASRLLKMPRENREEIRQESRFIQFMEQSGHWGDTRFSYCWRCRTHNGRGRFFARYR
ncbi:multidrug efflux pump subunit AcrB [Texcoconibacillus texcoconensis]|uniref:Multidrug efflux pump subunit AcrB n=1 Tax=Texcoconibacillus texcoconensis TaxID=1095777 RepID=A0A840QQP3_9BACI|nr:multidrug efflux pump subunit AcrB [Texcoconibacillus texcoconensis]